VSYHDPFVADFGVDGRTLTNRPDLAAALATTAFTLGADGKCS